MRAADKYLYGGVAASDAAFSPHTLSRLGSELALVYHDVLQAPLPSRLADLVGRMEAAERDRSGTDEVTLLPRKPR